MKYITSPGHRAVYAGIIFLVIAGCRTPEPQRPDVISDIQKYREQIAENNLMELVDLEIHIPGIVTDIRYATSNNFTGEQIYTEARAFARRPVSEALGKVQDSLSAHGLGLKIYDAYRPYSASVKFWEVYPDTNFVADPKYGSRHNRGCAVDVTLINLNTGEKIPMPTDYDDFSEKAHPQYMELSEDVIFNRSLLFGIMRSFGFTHYPTEWWHFDFKGWEKYPLMDISFSDLGK